MKTIRNITLNLYIFTCDEPVTETSWVPDYPFYLYIYLIILVLLMLLYMFVICILGSSDPRNFSLVDWPSQAFPMFLFTMNLYKDFLRILKRWKSSLKDTTTPRHTGDELVLLK